MVEAEVSGQGASVTILAQLQNAVIDERHDELIENRCWMAELDYRWAAGGRTHHRLRRTLTWRVQYGS